MNQLQVFSFENKSVRTQTDEFGNPWWIAKDVCEALGLKKPENAYSKVDAEDIADTLIQGDSQRRALKIVNESGLYSLIFQSETEAAKRFKRFVTSEVLPSIRQTGGFALNEKCRVYPVAEPVFKSLHSVAQIFGLENNQALLYANKATKRETGVDFQNVLQIELKNSDQVRAFTPTELGQRIGLSAVKFNRRLSDLGFQERRNEAWCATEKGKPFSLLLDAGKKHSDGTPIQQMKWIETILEQLSEAAA